MSLQVQVVFSCQHQPQCQVKVWLAWEEHILLDLLHQPDQIDWVDYQLGNVPSEVRYEIHAIAVEAVDLYQV